MVLTTICFDADDTLWHNERFFRLTEARFIELLSDFAEAKHLAEKLLEAERRNILRYGYGIKGFTLSMIETALEVTENRVAGSVIAEIISAGQEMLSHPIELLPGVEETVRSFADDFDLLMITKGDLMDQERKLAQSGLGDIFDGVEIVSEKTPETYREIFDARDVRVDAALMAGNSLKSDVNPVITVGGWGVFVPFGETWALERAEPLENHPRYRKIDRLSALPGVVKAICRNI